MDEQLQTDVVSEAVDELLETLSTEGWPLRLVPPADKELQRARPDRFRREFLAGREFAEIVYRLRPAVRPLEDIDLLRLAVPRNITLVRLPPYAPELNPLENVWEYLRGNKLAITVFESYDDIVDKSCAAWRFFADDPERVASITSRTWATVNP
jgi:transposase